MNAPETYDPKLTNKEWGGAISKLGIRKANTKFWQLLLLGFLGGLYISFGGHVFLAALAEGAGKIVASALFSIGLVLVVVAGAELFTGNVIMVVGLIGGRYSWGKLLKNWGTVYVGNLAGAMLYAYAVWGAGLFGRPGESTDIGMVAMAVASAKIAIPWWQAILRGVFCNILVLLAIIMSIMAKDVVSKILTCLLPVLAFVAVGFEHCVANMFLIPVGLLTAGAPGVEWLGLVTNVLPVTLGNIIGGIFILIIHPNRLRQLGYLRKSREPGKGQ